MSFARNFQLGMQIAGDAMDTYSSARQKRDLGRIADAKPVESEGFTAADGDQMRAMAAAINPETGRSYYDVQDDGQGGLQVRNNFAYEGRGGTPVEPGSITALQPKRVTDFLGQRYEGALSPDRLDSLRYRATADVIGKDDPVRGMQMRRELKKDEREDARFVWEEKAAPLKQRGLELSASAGERTERQGVRSDDIQKLDDAIAQMPREALEIYASKLNTNGSQYPMLYTEKTKDGFKFVTTDPDSGKPTGKSFVLNEAQLRQMAGASVLAMAGYGQESMARLTSANKDIADYIKTWNDTQSKVATSHNDAVHKGNQDRIAQQTADSMEMYRRQLGGAASARAAGGGAAVEDFQRKVDGVLEGYQVAMASGNKNAAAIYAREYDQLRATAPKGLRTPPALSSLNNAQKTQGSGKAFEKLPEQGTVVADENGTRLVYSNNGYPILLGGADPYDFGKVSAERGVDQNMLELGREKGLVSVHEYGRHITLGDKAYDITNKSDVAAFNAAMRKIAREALAEEERIRAEKYPQLGISGANGLAAETNRSVLGNIRQNTR